MRRKGTILITFAWAMEIVGVAAGMVNSLYTTFPYELPKTLWAWLPAIPMLILPVAELGRVPLASVLFNRHRLIQVVALLGMVVLGYLAFENWTFGFERIVQLRLEPAAPPAGGAPKSHTGNAGRHGQPGAIRSGRRSVLSSRLAAGCDGSGDGRHQRNGGSVASTEIITMTDRELLEARFAGLSRVQVAERFQISTAAVAAA